MNGAPVRWVEMTFPVIDVEMMLMVGSSFLDEVSV
jgi:hypothetical protein